LKRARCCERRWARGALRFMDIVVKFDEVVRTTAVLAPGKLAEAYGADLQDDSKNVMRKLIAAFRVAMQERITFESDSMNAPAGVGPSNLWRADELREVQQLAAAVRQQEESEPARCSGP
jgi:hypothetical protein